MRRLNLQGFTYQTKSLYQFCIKLLKQSSISIEIFLGYSNRIYSNRRFLIIINRQYKGPFVKDVRLLGKMGVRKFELSLRKKFFMERGEGQKFCFFADVIYEWSQNSKKILILNFFQSLETS